MSRKRAKLRTKKINPHFWVFCEGKTEEAYIGFLRSKYRLSIEIISKVSGHNISERYIKSFKKGNPFIKKIGIFLFLIQIFPKLRKS